MCSVIRWFAVKNVRQSSILSIIVHSIEVLALGDLFVFKFGPQTERVVHPCIIVISGINKSFYLKKNSLSQSRISFIEEESEAGCDRLEEPVDDEIVDEGQVCLPFPRVLLGPVCKQSKYLWKFGDF